MKELALAIYLEGKFHRFSYEACGYSRQGFLQAERIWASENWYKGEL